MSPLARPFALSPQPRTPSVAAGSQATSAAKDTVASASSRVSVSALEVIAGSLSERDREVLAFVQTLRLVSGHQLQRRFWPQADGSQARIARRALARLARLRILDRLPRVIGGVRAGSSGFAYHAGPVGLRLLARQGFRAKRIGAPGDRYVAHTLLISELVIRLHEAHASGILDLIEIQTEPACWRFFIGPGGARLTLKPDLFCRIGCGALEDRWMLEVDRATEARATITAKANQYLVHYRSGSEQSAHGVYPRVLWTVPDAHRAQQITVALSGLPNEARRIFAICSHDEFIERLAAQGRT